MKWWFAGLAALASFYTFAALQTSSSGAPAVQFLDITEASGIRFHHISAPEKKYIVESMSGGVALFDFDRDGCLDIYFTNSLTVETASNPKSSRSALYRGHCDGTFTDVTERAGVGYPGWAMGVLAADFDGDGWQDLYVTCLGPNRLYRNNGDGTFTDITARAGVDDVRWSAGAALGDMDNDGNQDLFVTNYVDFKLDDLPTFGRGKFCQYRGIPVQCGPRGLPGAGDSLFRNNGDGTFTNVTEKAGVADPEGRYGLGVVWTDVDGDGWQDIYVANDSGPNFLYHNKRNGAFEEIAFLAGCAVGEDGNEQGSMGIAVGDYLHTGRFAFFVTNFADEYNALYRHDEPLLFTDVSFQSGVARLMGPWVGWGTAFFDYDNDGWLDLMAVNGHVYPQVDSIPVGSRYAQRILLFRNNGDGTFSEVAAQAGEALMLPRVSRGAAFGDIDNDGDIDVVINNLDGKPTVLRNEGGNRNHWVSIRLKGQGRNPDALGARVKVVSGELVQWDEVRSGGSYISSSDLRLHFGLAHRERVDLIEVHWPGGKKELYRDLPADRFLTIEQGKGLVKSEPARRQS
jgi:hypothetical protein